MGHAEYDVKRKSYNKKVVNQIVLPIHISQVPNRVWVQVVRPFYRGSNSVVSRWGHVMVFALGEVLLQTSKSVLHEERRDDICGVHPVDLLVDALAEVSVYCDDSGWSW